MSLETVVEDIREEARDQAESIRSAADAEAAEIIEEAEADADAILAAAEAEASQQIERERERAKSSAGLEAKQERLAARRDLLEDVYAAVEEAIVDLDGEQRKELTTAVLNAGRAEFDDDASIRVYCREDDEELLESILADVEDATLDGTVDCLGGVVLESDEARVRVNNTFDSILETVWEDELKDISDQLFDA